MNRGTVRHRVVRARASAVALALMALAPTLIPAVTACTDIGPDVGERVRRLSEHRQRWLAVRPPSYVYAVERLCFCGFVGPVRVTVVNGVATDRVYVKTGEPVPVEQAEAYPTVDGLFDLLAEAIDRGAHEITVTYDEETGVPVDFWIDYEENVADEELGMRVTEPVAPPPSPAAS